jgi:hypothetical protein
MILQEPAAEAPAVNGEAPVADVAAAVESSADAVADAPKRVVSRERHTLFVGNLPFGKYTTAHLNCTTILWKPTLSNTAASAFVFSLPLLLFLLMH